MNEIEQPIFNFVELAITLRYAAYDTRDDRLQAVLLALAATLDRLAEVVADRNRLT